LRCWTGLTPPGIDIAFYDDRVEKINYDEPTDLVAINVETYTSRRAYQVAALFRGISNLQLCTGLLVGPLCLRATIRIICRKNGMSTRSPRHTAAVREQDTT
jgi:hypothetical protein